MVKGNLCMQTSDLFVDATQMQVAKVFFGGGDNSCARQLSFFIYFVYWRVATVFE
jgi:hypothetical protein